MNKTNPKATPPKKQIWLGCGILIAIGALIVGLIASVLHFTDPYHQGTQVHDMATAKRVFQHPQQAYQFVIVYEKHCQDCQHVKHTLRTIIPTARKHNQIVMLDADDPQVRKLALNNYVNNTPTFMLKYHQQILAIYAGTNAQQIEELSLHYNLQTNHPFNPQHQKVTYYTNDFNTQNPNSTLPALKFTLNGKDPE